MTRLLGITVVGVTVVTSFLFMIGADATLLEKLILFFLANLIVVVHLGFEGIIDAIKDKPRS